MFKSINGGILPCRFTRHSAGFDVYSNEDVVIGAGETKLIGLGIALDISMNAIDYKFNHYVSAEQKRITENFFASHYFALHIRSSLRAKGLTSLGTGVVDIDYRDEIKMVIHNPKSRNGHKWEKHNSQDCPKCGECQLDDDDGVNLHSEHGVVWCRECDTVFNYSKNFIPVGDDFPFDDTDIEWVSTDYEELDKYEIKKGDKIGQLILCKHEGWLLPSEYTKDEDRTGGFGSSDKENK